jgi:hypothetical protein
MESLILVVDRGAGFSRVCCIVESVAVQSETLSVSLVIVGFTAGNTEL